jgi:hypothetical protein
MKDPEMLATYLAKGNVLVTFDRRMLEDHEADIPELSPGLIVIAHSPAMMKTLTQSSAEKIIKSFKDKLPDWHQVPWANSIVKITDSSVFVGRKTTEGIVFDCEASLADPKCDETIKRHLVQNAK